MYHVDVFRIPCSGPGDVSGLQTLLQSGAFKAQDIVAVMGKTEGNGCVNDFTREYASRSLSQAIGTWLGLSAPEVEKRVAFVMSGGTEGVLSPHWTVFTKRTVHGAADQAEGRKRMSIGIAFTRDFLPEEIGRWAHIDATALAVHAAMQDASITRTEDVDFVQVKCPLLTSAKINEALARGVTPVTTETYASMGYSRAACALGVALAVGEVERAQISEAAVLNDWQLCSSVASVSAGVELEHNVVIVMGMSEQSCSDLVIGHAVMQDAIDVHAVRQAMHAAGVDDSNLHHIVNVFAKAEASPDGGVRGHRHTMLVDSDIHSTRHARAVTGAVVASVVGHGMVYVSGGAEHQGPTGGGPVAVIARSHAGT